MNVLFRFLSMITLILTCAIGSSQYTDVINNQINYEFGVQDNLYTGAGDSSGDAEPNMISDFWNSSTGWLGEFCYSWQCEPPCNNYSNSIWYYGTNQPFDVTFSIWLQCFESDNEGGSCSYQSGDDDLWSGLATLRDGLSTMPVVYPSSNFRPCNWNPWLASGTGWIFPNAGAFDQIWKETWRYTDGDESTDPLNFGTIAIGSTKSDINATRAVETVTVAPLQYTNTGLNDSPDVWYSFSLDVPSDVTISTNHDETDYDTFLRLYTVDGDYIAENDDVVAGDLQSQIVESLYPGTYLIGVEGYESNSGLFKLTVTASGNTSGIKEDELAESIRIFPNPSSGSFNIDLREAEISSDASIEIMDGLGKIVYSERASSTLMQMDLGFVESGIYMLRISSNGIRSTKRFTIQR